MNGHAASVFAQWYISAFLVGFGLLTLIRPEKMLDPKCLFRREFRDRSVAPRLTAILERRRRIEAFPRAGYTLVGVVSIALGSVTALGRLTPVIAYSALCFAIALTLGAAFVRMRNTNVRRAATLTPRVAGSAVHPIWYGCAAIASLLPLAVLGSPQLRVSAVLVACCSLVIVATAVRIAGMASILTGDDGELEVLVDERLRSGRVATMLIYAFTVPFVFFGMGTPTNTFGQSFAFAWSGAFFLAYGCWYACTYFGAMLSPEKQWRPTR